jgi:hypothetical protein
MPRIVGVEANSPPAVKVETVQTCAAKLTPRLELETEG